MPRGPEGGGGGGMGGGRRTIPNASGRSHVSLIVRGEVTCHSLYTERTVNFLC